MRWSNYWPLIIVILAISCASRGNRQELGKAQSIASQLHEGMAFAEVSKLIPLTRNNELGIHEHGGVWYDVPVGKHYYIQLRFEHPKDGDSYLQSKLNLPARIKKSH